LVHTNHIEDKFKRAKSDLYCSLTGAVTRSQNSQSILTKERIGIKLEDIEIIQVKKTEAAGRGFLIRVGIVSLIAIVAAAVLAGSCEGCAT